MHRVYNSASGSHLRAVRARERPPLRGREWLFSPAPGAVRDLSRHRHSRSPPPPIRLLACFPRLRRRLLLDRPPLGSWLLRITAGALTVSQNASSRSTTPATDQLRSSTCADRIAQSSTTLRTHTCVLPMRPYPLFRDTQAAASASSGPSRAATSFSTSPATPPATSRSGSHPRGTRWRLLRCTSAGSTRTRARPLCGGRRASPRTRRCGRSGHGRLRRCTPPLLHTTRRAGWMGGHRGRTPLQGGHGPAQARERTWQLSQRSFFALLGAQLPLPALRLPRLTNEPSLSLPHHQVSAPDGPGSGQLLAASVEGVAGAASLNVSFQRSIQNLSLSEYDLSSSVTHLIWCAEGRAAETAAQLGPARPRH